MNYKLFSALSFVAGATIGSVVTWKLIEKKYQQIAQEEIESVKEVYSSKRPSIDECVDEIIRQTDNKPDVMEYAAKIADLGYNGEKKSEEKEEEDSMEDVPYVISVEEFEESDYTAETLTLYADGVLTSDWNDEVFDDDDIADTVGKDVVEKFEEYANGEDTVYVRNDNRELDYEIQRDTRKYADVHSDESVDG